MGIDLSALATNANKLDECINKNKKQEQDRQDEQLYCIIERKVKKEEHKREKPRSRDGALKKCERLFEEVASSEVLTKLEESLREQEKYYRYYVQCFLPVPDKAIEQSKKISNETKERVKQVIQKLLIIANIVLIVLPTTKMIVGIVKIVKQKVATVAMLMVIIK